MKIRPTNKKMTTLQQPHRSKTLQLNDPKMKSQRSPNKQHQEALWVQKDQQQQCQMKTHLVIVQLEIQTRYRCFEQQELHPRDLALHPSTFNQAPSLLQATFNQAPSLLQATFNQDQDLGGQKNDDNDDSSGESSNATVSPEKCTDGRWSEWKEKFPCSADCGSCGRSQRERECLSFKNGKGCPCTYLTNYTNGD